MSAVATNAAVAAGGLTALGLSALAARDGAVSGAERGAFHAVNDLPSWLYPPMSVVQQSGNIVVAVVIVMVVALSLRSWPFGVAGLAAVAAKLGLERVVKLLVERQRPATSTGDAILRGDVSAHGLSFVSGHAVMTAALATLLTPLLPGRWRFVPWLVVALNGVARLYVGAHNPLDVVGGVGLGLFIGAVINVAMGSRLAVTRGARAPEAPPAAVS